MNAETIEMQISDDEYRELEQIDRQPDTRHFRHPIDPAKTWCGKPNPGRDHTYIGLTNTVPPDKITCADCLHLYINKGANWWWDVHRCWYGTSCSDHEHQHCA